MDKIIKTESTEITTTSQYLKRCIESWVGNKLTVSDCLTATHISKLTRNHGSDTIENLVCALVVAKMELFPERFRMNQTQIKFFVETFVADFKNESVADLSVCLTNVAKGVHGEIKFEITPSRVREWFTRHLDDKALAREQKKNREKFGTDWDSKVIETVKGAISRTKKSKTMDDIKNDTSSTWWSKIMQQIDVMDEKYLHDLRKQMKNASIRGNYDEQIKDIDNELNTRK